MARFFTTEPPWRLSRIKGRPTPLANVTFGGLIGRGCQSLLESGLRVKIYASAFVQLVFSANMPPKGGD